jgi:transitional endoplasmic reticulum ATPase
MVIYFWSVDRIYVEVISKYYGEAEARLRSIFEKAASSAPCLIFIDEIDSLAPDRSSVEGEVEKRLVAQLLG